MAEEQAKALVEPVVAMQETLVVEGSLAMKMLEQIEQPSENDADGDDDDRPGRRKRRTRARARTISIRRLSKAELNRGREQYPESDYWRPASRGDCAEMERPCPFVGCKYHLYIDVHPVRGSIKVNFPDVEVWEMTETCALDVADRGGTTLEEVGAIMNLTRERIRQVEVKALAKLDALKEMMALRDYVDEGPVGKRRLPTLTKKDLFEDDEEEEVESVDEDEDEDEELFEKSSHLVEPPDFDLMDE